MSCWEKDKLKQLYKQAKPGEVFMDSEDTKDSGGRVLTTWTFLGHMALEVHHRRRRPMCAGPHAQGGHCSGEGHCTGPAD